MTRYLVAGLLLAASLSLFGCADVEPPVRARAPVEAVPSEPSGVEGHAPAEDIRQTDEAPPQPGDTQEPAAAAVEAAPQPVEGNKPQVPDANDPEPTEPNSTDATRSDGAVRAVQEPNDIAEPAAGGGASWFFDDRYAEILATYVREDGLVSYGELRRRRLDIKGVLTELDELDPSVYEGWSRQEKLAFWINAYNLKMLDIIARNYPIESSWWLRLTWPPSDIRHIKGIWTDHKFIVMDEEFTLAEVEQRFFRRGTGGSEIRPYGDPRAYLAITYASQSSPPLRARPYRGDDLDRQLDAQVKAFLASPQGLQIDRRARVVRLSALFKPGWRGKEFVTRYSTDRKFKSREPETRAVLSFLTNYLSREDVEFLEVENYAIEYLNFDWRLNDTSKGY